jgi:hypothetical protein
MPNVKEPGYFSTKVEKRKRHDYLSLFEHAEQGQEVGEASTSYFYTPQSAQDIKNTLPDVKLIVQLRDPVDRAFSQYKLRRNSGLEQRDFLEAFRIDKQYTEKKSKPQTGYYDRSRYYTHVSRYSKLFDESDILVTYFSNFTGNRRITIAKVADFLKIDPDKFRKSSLHYNSSETDIGSKMGRWIRQDSNLKWALKKVIPETVRSKIVRELYRLRSTVNNNETLDPEVEEQVRYELRHELTGLENLIGGKSENWNLEP